MADTARGERAQADRVARSAVLTRGEPVTWGRHLRQCGVRPGALGQRARRHYWLAPRSDDAVGAGFTWGRALARLQQRDIGCYCLGPASRARWRSWPSGAVAMPARAGRASVALDA